MNQGGHVAQNELWYNHRLLQAIEWPAQEQTNRILHPERIYGHLIEDFFRLSFPCQVLSAYLSL
jgi:hypothetical protein